MFPLFRVPRVGLAIVMLAPGLGLVVGVVVPGPKRGRGKQPIITRY